MARARRRQRDPEELAAEVLALVNAHTVARDQITTSVLQQIAGALAELVDWYDPRQVDAFVAAATDAVATGRAITSDVTEAYLRQQLDALGVPAGRHVAPDPADLPRGIPTTEEWARPVKQYRYARLQGLDALEAEDRAAQRAETMARTDLDLAMRDTSRDVLAPLERVTGYRRILHPELSAGGACGLCVVAADRLYHRGELLPLHDRCKCTVMPVVGDQDPGHTLNEDELRAIYGAAGSTGRQALAKLRFTVEAHSELGPVLRREGDHFRDGDQVADDTGRPADLQPADTPPVTVAASPANLRELSDDELANLVSDPEVAADADRLEAVLAELDRRDDAERTSRELTEAEALSDEDFAAAVRAAQADRNGFDAEAEDAGLSPEEYDAPRRGGTPQQQVREDWELFVHEQMLAAEDATRGNLLSPAGKRAGADVYALFTGDAVQSIRWASEELLAWWQEDERRRMSWPEWRSQVAGTSSPAARRSRDRFAKSLQRWEDTRGRGRGRSGRRRAS